ncbi:hypothetical protein ACEWY4_013961 [Coilia grayii]|uniref:Ubiquitin-like protease family profile domain-containing protein n=1 Tax=Coilia grayii TaxID=363190 RepID=A0ABD1JQX5_9TELE
MRVPHHSSRSPAPNVADHRSPIPTDTRSPTNNVPDHTAESVRSQRRRVPKTCDCCGPHTPTVAGRGHSASGRGHSGAANDSSAGHTPPGGRRRGRPRKDEYVSKATTQMEMTVDMQESVSMAMTPTDKQAESVSMVTSQINMQAESVSMATTQIIMQEGMVSMATTQMDMQAEAVSKARTQADMQAESVSMATTLTDMQAESVSMATPQTDMAVDMQEAEPQGDGQEMEGGGQDQEEGEGRAKGVAEPTSQDMEQTGPQPANQGQSHDQTLSQSVAANPPPPPRLLNGTVGGVSDGEMEAEPSVSPPPCQEYCGGALWDHAYCKRPRTHTHTHIHTHTPHTENNHEGLVDLIHEYLEDFYEKYGSFIPLCEDDIHDYLNRKSNTDLSDGKLVKWEVAKYKAGLATVPTQHFCVSHNKHTLSLDDLATLEDHNWVNDQVINMYGELIMEAANHKVHFFNSFFYRQLVAKGYEGVKRWTKKVDLFSKRLLLVPLHLEVHWSLLTVDVSSRSILFYDSQGIMFKYAVDNILKYLLAEAKEKKQLSFQKGWKMMVNKCIPQQKNDSDCGVFVLEYCKCLAQKQPLLFSQEDMPRVRKRIYQELCEGRLRDVPSLRD